jgi:hypothetical protein
MNNSGRVYHVYVQRPHTRVYDPMCGRAQMLYEKPVSTKPQTSRESVACFELVTCPDCQAAWEEREHEAKAPWRDLVARSVVA